MPLRSILRIQFVTFPGERGRSQGKLLRICLGWRNLGPPMEIHGKFICGTASKASQSMGHSRKVSLQRLQVGPGKEVSSWWRGGGSVGPGSSGLDLEGRRWPAITLISLSSKSCSHTKRFKQRRMFGNEQAVPE